MLEITTSIAITTAPYIYDLYVHKEGGEFKLYHEKNLVDSLVLQGDTLVRVYDFVDDGEAHEVKVSDISDGKTSIWDHCDLVGGGYSWKQFAGDQGPVNITVEVCCSQTPNSPIKIQLDPPRPQGGIMPGDVQAHPGNMIIVTTTRIMMQGTPLMRNQIMLNQTADLMGRRR